MNSRRLIASPEAQDKALYRSKLAHWKGPSAALVRSLRESQCPRWVNLAIFAMSAARPLILQDSP
jgi:hypothetical protein